MSDIEVVSLEEIQNNLENYHSKKIRISEFQFYVTTEMVYEDYYIQIGPKGGSAIHYDQGRKKVTLGSRLLNKANLTDGVHVSGGWKTIVALPSRKQLPKILREIEDGLVRNVKQYKTTYDNAAARLERINKLNEEYPELSI